MPLILPSTRAPVKAMGRVVRRGVRSADGRRGARVGKRMVGIGAGKRVKRAGAWGRQVGGRDAREIGSGGRQTGEFLRAEGFDAREVDAGAIERLERVVLRFRARKRGDGFLLQ